MNDPILQLDEFGLQAIWAGRSREYGSSSEALAAHVDRIAERLHCLRDAHPISN